MGMGGRKLDFNSIWHEAQPAWSAFVALCGEIRDATWFRLFCYVLLVAATIWAIARVYSGGLQNAEKGPVALRRHKGAVGFIPLNTIVVHRDFIELTNDGVHAHCTFYYVYEGHRGKRQHIKLLARQMRLSVSPTKHSDKVLGIVRGNEVPDVKQEEVYWPALDPETETPTHGDATPEQARAYARQNKVLERWTGDDNLQLISVHESLLNDVRDARDEFIGDRVGKLREAKSGNWIRKLSAGKWARLRPGAVGNYYVRFRFSNDPIFVLRKHPDRDVRMTAWLTLLTSLFAIAMELFPLHAPADGARNASATPAHSPPPRVRVP